MACTKLARHFHIEEARSRGLSRFSPYHEQLDIVGNVAIFEELECSDALKRRTQPDPSSNLGASTVLLRRVCDHAAPRHRPRRTRTCDSRPLVSVLFPLLIIRIGRRRELGAGARKGRAASSRRAEVYSPLTCTSGRAPRNRSHTRDSAVHAGRRHHTSCCKDLGEAAFPWQDTRAASISDWQDGAIRQRSRRILRQQTATASEFTTSRITGLNTMTRRGEVQLHLPVFGLRPMGYCVHERAER